VEAVLTEFNKIPSVYDTKRNNRESPLFILWGYQHTFMQLYRKCAQNWWEVST